MDFDHREFDRKQKVVNEVRDTLLADFDSVIVMGCWQTEDGSTATVHSTGGNWHAQNGMADYFLLKRRQEPKLEAFDQHQEQKGE
jgi:hypothetical protein